MFVQLRSELSPIRIVSGEGLSGDKPWGGLLTTRDLEIPFYMKFGMVYGT